MPQEPSTSLSIDERRAFVASFPHWYQRIYLGGGVWTMGGRGFHEEVWERFASALPADLAGRSVLDLGTNAGYFALQCKLRGAGTVVGVEFIDMYLQQALRIREIWNVDIDYRRTDVHGIGAFPETFDLVVCAGILYHLKNPLQVLEDASRRCRDAILVETEAIPPDPRNAVMVRQGAPPTLQRRGTGIMKFIEGDELNGDGSNWWVPDAECVMGMLRASGFVHVSRPVFLAETRLAIVASKRPDSLLDLKAFGA